MLCVLSYFARSERAVAQLGLGIRKKMSSPKLSLTKGLVAAFFQIREAEVELERCATYKNYYEKQWLMLRHGVPAEADSMQRIGNDHILFIVEKISTQFLNSLPCHRAAGLGACGLTTDGDKEMVIALPHDLMGTQSNDNPYCGKTVTISYKGTSITAKVVDKCMGCTGYSIDLSNLAFSSLGISFNQGRVIGIWYFNN